MNETVLESTKKYRDCLDIVDRCAAAKDARSATEEFDNLVRYMRDNFPLPDAANIKEDAAAAKTFIKNSLVPEEEVRMIPPPVADHLYFIYLLKYLLSNCAAPIDVGISKEISWCHSVCAPIVVGVSFANVIS